MNRLCDYGCGQQSSYMIGNKVCCCKSPSRCPGPPILPWIEDKQSGLIPREVLENSNFSVFHNYFFPDPIVISTIIKDIKWGSNRVIRQQGFRVLPISESIKPIKQWDRITSPYFIINKSMYLSQPKGQSIIVIHIGDLP